MPIFTVSRGVCRHCGAVVQWDPTWDDYEVVVPVAGKNQFICYGNVSFSDHEPAVEADYVTTGLLDVLRQLAGVA